ncbi:MAG: peptidase M48, partial [Sphingobacteriales bacterium]
MKVLIQLFVLIALFLSCYFGLSQFNWVRIMHVEEISRDTERKLGDLIWGSVSESAEEITDVAITGPVDTLVRRLCVANKIDRPVKIHILLSEELNAFALPDNHLVILSGLLRDCDNESELLG